MEITGANPDFERGKLNASLKAIGAACAREGIEDVPREIHIRARAYRKLWPLMTLTPTALAKHWCRVVAELRRADSRAERLHQETQDLLREMEAQ